ncbi:hypothetical protein GCM10025768_04600 [Microbacterium pseudoresistens]|uniref:Uncharacterized protein n=1 Tax=Microbacterium pseudoresistens TaxID=640634 RepID=A0A7Y9EUX6_9MICO|nr:hypothetical protein [Microbacterium pseudoresistens]NYD54296.1 hypothetical protein [Microbacterium pseudoresistens]
MADVSDGSARLGRSGWTVLAALLALAVVAGLRAVAGLAETWFAPLLVPPAIGLPTVIPALRIAPLGETTTAVWIIDLVGVAVMLLAAALSLRAAWRRHPYPGRWHTFWRAFGVTISALVCASLVRGIALSFLLRADVWTYLGQLLGGVLVAVIVGAVAGLVVGVLAAIVGSGRDPDPMPEPDPYAWTRELGIR